jgi:hypothetical protein
MILNMLFVCSCVVTGAGTKVYVLGVGMGKVNTRLGTSIINQEKQRRREKRAQTSASISDRGRAASVGGEGCSRSNSIVMP